MRISFSIRGVCAYTDDTACVRESLAATVSSTANPAVPANAAVPVNLLIYAVGRSLWWVLVRTPRFKVRTECHEPNPVDTVKDNRLDNRLDELQSACACAF